MLITTLLVGFSMSSSESFSASTESVKVSCSYDGPTETDFSMQWFIDDVEVNCQIFVCRSLSADLCLQIFVCRSLSADLCLQIIVCRSLSADLCLQIFVCRSLSADLCLQIFVCISFSPDLCLIISHEIINYLIMIYISFIAGG